MSDAPRRGTSRGGRLAWRRLEPFGVELEGDLRAPLDPEQRELFRELFYANALLVARGQALPLEDQIRVVEYITPVQRFSDNVTCISNDPQEGLLGDQPLPFHADLLWTEHPRRVSSLHALDLRDGASYTEFINGAQTYAALSDELRAELEGVVALHVLSDRLMTDRLVRGESAMGRHFDPETPHARHPAVSAHPVTGLPILAVTETDTVALEGLGRERALELGEILLRELYRPDRIHRHWWHRGDLVIWDNLALQHSRGSCQGIGRRTLQAVAAQPRALTELDPRAGGDARPELNYGRSFPPRDPKGAAGS